MCKFFFRIPITEPDSGGQFITDPAGSGSYLEIFLTLEKNMLLDHFMKYGTFF
jgi:hypothetical protein